MQHLFGKIRHYFSKGELLLWGASVAAILAAFFLFDRENYLALLASCIGVTSLIFNVRGNPLGQILMLLFSLIYGIISYSCAYYGEMATYLGMTAPMALFAFIAWIRNPYEGNRAEVKVNRLRGREICLMCVLTILVTWLFYYILAVWETANLLPSTISVTTSFLAVYLTFRRSAYYALGYAANDIVLIVLWCMATAEDPAYISVVVCFSVFLLNDLYGFIRWRQMQRRQEKILH